MFNSIKIAFVIGQKPSLSAPSPLASRSRRDSLTSALSVAMPYEQAREACNRLLVELDEDIRNYIIDMLGGDESEEKMKAVVAEFLVSTEHCADEDAAMVKVTELFASLSAATPADPATLNAELRILDATVSLAASADDKLFREKVPLCRCAADAPCSWP